MKETRRTERVANIVRSVVGNYLITEGHDSRFSRAVITDCRVTPDLRIARVYFTILGTEQREHVIRQVEDDLSNSKRSMRLALGKALRTKYTPELTFHFDETLESARRIEELIKNLPPASDDEPEA